MAEPKITEVEEHKQEASCCLHAETRMTSRSCRNGVFSWLHNCISLRGAQ